MASGRPIRGMLLPIVVAVAGLAAIAVAEDVPARHSMERKLTVDSAGALRRAGVPFSSVHFVGRDGRVTVPSTGAGTAALAVVRNVHGVRVVDVVVAGQLGSGGTPVVAAPKPAVSLTVVPSIPPSTPPPSTPPPSTPPPSTLPPSPSPPSPSPPSPSPAQPAASVPKQLDALGEITFASGSSTLTDRDRTIVKRAAAILMADPDVDVRVDGDTDSIGPAAFNLAMSRLRAHAVAVALYGSGVASSRVTVIGYGETRPRVPNDSARHRGINRRVDILATV